MPGKLKCDATDCDHKEDYGELSRDLIGKECPKCGANLLTEEDYIAGLRVEAMIGLLKDLGLATYATDPDDKSVLMSFNPHAGSMTIKIGGAK